MRPVAALISWLDRHTHGRWSRLPPDIWPRVLFWLSLAAVAFLTRGAIMLPLTTSWHAAAALVDMEDEFARLRAEAAEYRAAADAFRQPYGKEHARRLRSNDLAPGEHPIILEPAPGTDNLAARRHVRDWLTAQEALLAARAKRLIRILERLVRDPPSPPEAA